MIVAAIVVLCSLFAPGRPDMCQANVTASDLPDGILKTIVTMALGGPILGFTGCLQNTQIEPEKIGFYLYNKENPNAGIRLDHENPAQIQPGQKIIFLTPGWTCNITGQGFPEMKDAYLKRYPDANVIIVDWAEYSIDLYVHAFCHIPKIAEVFGKFICNLKAKYNIDTSEVHLVGHSMGGQISGLTGQETKKQCSSKIGRITGLDPAGPIYQEVSASRRLDETDATVVDVIHTSQGTFGYRGACGTVDYFPNCGYGQPGCVTFSKDTKVTDVLSSPSNLLICSHQRSVDYMIESILTKGFEAKSCHLCPGPIAPGECVADLVLPKQSFMGEDHVENPASARKYFLTTNSASPFTK